MKSITGVEFNNRDICVKGSNFACICDVCTSEYRQKAKEYRENPDKYLAKRKAEYEANTLKGRIKRFLGF